jgi:hypothetical protein
LGNGGETPLTTVLDAPPTTDGSGKKVEVTRMLLEAGADVNHQNRQGNTALMKTGASDSKTVNVLLRYGADPNLKNRQGETPLLKTVQWTVAMDVDDEEGIENEKALALARHGADISEAVSYLRNEGYQNFARKLIRASGQSSSY